MTGRTSFGDFAVNAVTIATDSWLIAPGRALTLDQPRILGVLNVTPDSFSDGGRHRGVDEALAHALRMIDEGASIIDVGGESTRPGAARVPAAEQIDRTALVIEAIAARSTVPISIDTTSSEVAAAALDAGASIINDVSAGRDDDRMLPLAGSRGCGLILMHRLFPPGEDRYSDRYEKPAEYGDVVADVRAFLMLRVASAIDAGVEARAIVIDPGRGFGKSVAQNYELIARIGELVATGHHVLSAASRKSFIGAVSGVEQPADRVAGSVAISVAHWLAGVRLFRVHDVAAHREALAVAAAIRAGSAECRLSIDE
jgi:dihydropteroate synthase